MVQITDPISAAEAGFLGNYGNNLYIPGQEPFSDPFYEPGFSEVVGRPGASRRWALALRERLWSVSSISDVRKCGKVPRERSMPILEAPGGLRMSGLCTCHSVWLCPICAPEIRAARGVEIAAALGRRLGDGGGVSFGTGTLSHGSGHSLRSTYGLVVGAWAAVQRDRLVKRFQSEHGYWGFVRTAEVTYGLKHGWHPHLHWLDFWEESLSWDDLKAYEAVVLGAWSRAVARESSRYVSKGNGVLVLPVRSGEVEDMAKYVTEMPVKAAAFELTAISTKQARASGLSPFELLAKVYGPGSKPWVDLWWEYEQSTRHRRMLGSTRGLLSRLGVGDEEPEPVEKGEPVAYVPSDLWGRIRWETNSGLSGVQAILEEAAKQGQLGVNRAINMLLGLRGVTLPVEDPQLELELGPGDDGGMF